MCGGGKARIVVITTATGRPGQVLAEYEQVFRKLGVRHVKELPISGRADADGPSAAAALDGATGVFLSGGDQSRLQTLVGSRINDQLSQRLADGLVVAGTSAGATALGRTMILGGNGAEVATAAVRTAPGLGLMPRMLIDMHFGERGRLPRLLSAVALEPDRLGVGIDENTAICVRKDTLRGARHRRGQRRRRGTGHGRARRVGHATRSRCSTCGCICCRPAACSTWPAGRRPSARPMRVTEPADTRRLPR